MDIFTIVGLAGVGIYILSYASIQAGVADGNGVPYNLANVAAASLVLFSLSNDFNLASAIIQVTWIAIGVGGLCLRLYRRSAGKLAPRDKKAANVTVAGTATLATS